jgi:hypothetical protein
MASSSQELTMRRMFPVAVCMALLVFASPLRAENANDKDDDNIAPYVGAGVVLHLNSDPATDTWRLGGEGQCLFYAIAADQERAEALRKLAVDTHIGLAHRRASQRPGRFAPGHEPGKPGGR